MTKVKLPLFFLFCMFLIFQCDNPAGSDYLAEYGIPKDLNLDCPCPGNGTWLTKVLSSGNPVAKTSLPNDWEAMVVIKNWTVEIHEMRWYNTGVCTYVTVGSMNIEACDYRLQQTGRVKRGYIDPNSTYTDSYGNKLYIGKTTDGDDLRYWDYAAPGNLYLNFRYNGESEWWKQTLYPF